MRTKIIATIGPASSDAPTLLRMMDEGVDVFRLNFSHGSHQVHKEVIQRIHQLNEERGSHVAILADLQGPKIRIGDLQDESIMLKNGDEFVLTTEACEGTEARIHIAYEHFPADVKIGEKILLDDGKLMLQISDTDRTKNVRVKVLHGGPLKSRKGVNLPDTKISMPSLTQKDMEDLDFIMQQGVQWVALSFVRSAKDIKALRQLIDKHPAQNKPLILAKIEKPEALNEIDSIILQSDGIMVARGDLGIEIPLEQVPVVQKKLINSCLKYGRPVIVATQMMEGMIDNIRPTRAEVNDVANSVMDGADALMLSGETSVGKYPVETVATMERIIGQVEADENIYFKKLQLNPTDIEKRISVSVLQNAVQLAQEVNAKAFVLVSHSGYSTIRISSQRPKTYIYAFSDNANTLKTLSLIWGVVPVLANQVEDLEKLREEIVEKFTREKILDPGDLIIALSHFPSRKRGHTNTIRLFKL